MALFLRADLLDLITLPASAKLQDSTVLTHLLKILHDLWPRTYKGVELRPLALDAPAGASRSALPLWITLKDWLATPDGVSAEHRLPLSSVSKKAYWTRFVVVLHHLQKIGLIRDALKPETSSPDLTAAIEFRYFAALMWLQTVRVASAWPRSEASVGRRPRSVSDGALEAPWSSPPNWDCRRHAALSPRQAANRAESTMSLRLKAFVNGNGVLDEVPAVQEAFFKALPGLLCIIGFHINHALNWTQENSLNTDRSVSTSASLSDLFLSAHHLKYLSLVLQLRSVRRGVDDGNEFMYETPAPTKILEKHIFTELQNAKLLIEHSSATPLISIGYLIDWLRNTSRVEVANVDALSSFAFALGGTLPTRSPSTRPKNERRSRRFKSPDRTLLLGRRKEVIHVPPPDLPADLLIMDCVDCSIIANTRFVNVKIGNCRNLRVIVPCATGSVILHFGKNVAVHCACSGILVSNSYDTRLYVLSSTPPVIVGDTRDLHLGPYNVLFDGQQELLAETGIEFNAQSLRAFSTPIICPLSYTGRTSTPRDDMSKLRGSVDDTFMLSESGLMPSLVKPQDLEILLMPGDKNKPPPVPPKNLVLPEAHAQGVANAVLKRQAALAAFLERVAKCRTPEQKQQFLQKTQARFCEWLQTHRKVNELLSRSEDPRKVIASPAAV